MLRVAGRQSRSSTTRRLRALGMNATTTTTTTTTAPRLSTHHYHYNDHRHYANSTAKRYSSNLAAAAAAAAATMAPYRFRTAATSETTTTSSHSFLQHHNHHHQQRRFYFYIPTSWTELQLRMRDKGETKAREVKVKLHQFWNKHAAVAGISSAGRLSSKLKNANHIVRVSSLSHRKSKMLKSAALTSRHRAVLWRRKARQRGREWTTRMGVKGKQWWTNSRTKMSKFKHDAQTLYGNQQDGLEAWLEEQQQQLRLLRLLDNKEQRQLYKQQGREWLERQQQQLLLLRNDFKGRKMQFYRSRVKDPLTSGSVSSNSSSSSSNNSRNVDLSLVRRRRGRWVSSPPPPLAEVTPESASHRVVVKIKEYSEASWFDAASGRPLVSRDATGRFVNPWLSQSSDGVHPLTSIIRWRQIRLAREWAAWKEYCMEQWIRPLLNNYLPFAITATECQAPVGTLALGPDTQQQPLQEYSTTPVSRAQDDQRQMEEEEEEEQEELADDGTLRLTWIGHATCLLQQGNISILTDPIFSVHASPLPPMLAPIIGVARYEPPLRVSSRNSDDDDDNDDTDTVVLPDDIDVCIISHDHYDHLDLPSVHQLADRVGCWAVPIGVGEFLRRHTSIPAHRIVELEWWESAKLVRKPADSHGEQQEHDWRCVQIHSLHPRSEHSDENEVPQQQQSAQQHHPARYDPANENQLWITATPLQHWASRTMMDRNYRLWAGFCVFLDQQQTFYFAGDTAFPQEFPLFEQVADYIASAKQHNDDEIDDDDDQTTIVDLAALPIGAYQPRFLNHTSHMEPKDALRVHEILQCRQSVAIHHGTFCLSEEPPDEPPRLLREAIIDAAAAAAQEQDGVADQNIDAALNFVAIPLGSHVDVEPSSSSSHIIASSVVDHDAVYKKGSTHPIGALDDENGEENDEAAAASG